MPVLSSALLLAAAPAVPPPSDPVLVRAGRVIVRPGLELADAAVLVQEGRIAAVGTGLVAPEGAEVIEGSVVCAGFLDPWSSLGVEPASLAEARTSASTSTADAIDAYRDLHLREDALRSGVTSVRVQVGPHAEVGGIGAVLRTDPALEPGEWMLLDDACVAASVGVTRSGQKADVFDRVEGVDRLAAAIQEGADYVRELAEYEVERAEWEAEIAKKEEELEKDFKKAKKDREKEIEEAEEKGKEHREKRYREDRPPRKPRYDADDEVFGRVADGELPLVVEAHRAEEVRELLEATEKFSRLRLVLAGGTEAAAYADVLAERRIPVIVWPAPYGVAGRDEYAEHGLGLAAELDEAGVTVLLGSGGLSAAATRDLPLLAALAAGHGLARESAMEAVTLGPARAFDLADRLGSIERGKSADLLVLDGDPLSTDTRVRYVVSGGRVVVRP